MLRYQISVVSKLHSGPFSSAEASGNAGLRQDQRFVPRLKTASSLVDMDNLGGVLVSPSPHPTDRMSLTVNLFHAADSE